MLTVLVLLAGTAFTFGLVRAVASEIPQLDPSAQHAQVDGVIYASNGRSVLAVLRGDESRVLLSDIGDVSRDHAPGDRLGRGPALLRAQRRRHPRHPPRRSGRTSARRRSSRAAPRSRSSSSRTRTSATRGRSRGRCARRRSPGSSSRRWTKDRILLAYLNTIYFGNGAYGIQQAARTYFGKGAKRLTLPEAALLAGLPADPSLYDPVRHPRAARLRRHYVLKTMFDQGKISARQLQNASKAPLPKPEDVRLPGTQGPGQYFANYVKDQLIAKYGAGRVFGGGLKVTSTIDLELQETAHKAIESVLKTPGGPAAALVAIDPRTGAVKAMVGGSNFRESQFNLATQAERQPGSSFKPFVLATALREGISPVTTFESHPVDIDAGDRVWHVTNYEGDYLGRIDLARAMVSSDNSVYAQLTKLVGPKSIVRTAHELGIRSELDPYFSIGLGFVAVNPLDMTRAYATFANRGVRVDGSLNGRQATRCRARRVRAHGAGRREPAGRHRRAAAGAGRPAHLDPAERRHAGHRQACRPPRPPGRRQDRDDGQLRRRLVRRLHAAARRRRLGRLPGQAAADADRVRRRARRRRDAPGA